MKLHRFMARYISTVPTIADCHATRIGWARTITGGMSMYLSIPVWLLFHLSSSTTLYHFFLRPLLGLKKISIDDYVVLDRHTIDGMALVDRINCIFCGYANGLTKMMNDQIDQLEKKCLKRNYLTLIPVYFLALIFTIISFLGHLIAIELIYNSIVAPILGMNTTKGRAIISDLISDGYGNKFNKLNRSIIVYNKSVFKRLSLLLEQIESSWCPLTHLKRNQTVVYPDHHENFFSPSELEQMKEKIIKDGTVIPK